ncbi:hypothetical protein SO802_010005 [Lithocarpus litseifolius]|uniref:Uncharacterized protein n=1 Tax=Lithocarpus litseifolius TaxID=425828 RepID=A0AAW2DFN4_9ROSI
MVVLWTCGGGDSCAGVCCGGGDGCAVVVVVMAVLKLLSEVKRGEEGSYNYGCGNSTTLQWRRSQWRSVL